MLFRSKRPPVFLNHFYVVLDSATYKDIEQSAFLRREFAVTEQRTTVRTDMTYTGLYFYGTNTYFEFFDVSSDASSQVGFGGIALGVDQQGELVRDKYSSYPWKKKAFADEVRLPYERAGTLIVFKVFDKLSYGLIIGARAPMRVADRVYNP